MATEHTDVLTSFDGELVLDPERIFSIRNPEHVHPGLRETWPNNLELYDFEILYQPFATIEEKRAAIGQVDFTRFWQPLGEDVITVDEYQVEGCPEEPDAPLVPVYVFTPKKLEGKTNRRVIFALAGGGMLFCDPPADGLDHEACAYDCVVVSPRYRTSLDAPYPAAINDCHAAYKWMIDNAEMLGIDPDMVVIMGRSSGGGLAASIPFRLMRYGYRPRGVFAMQPITDDREVYPCSSTVGGFIEDAVGSAKGFDSIDYHTAYRMWLGYNYGSYRVGPEALANHATVEDCIGYPPTIIISDEYDPDRDYNREFAGKLYAAHTFCDYYCFGGSDHGRRNLFPEIGSTFPKIVKEGILNFWKYDLRRPWAVEEYKAHVERVFANR